LKTSPRKRLVKKLDNIFSLYIRARDKDKCFTCGTKQNPTCGHLITRSKYSVRWDEKNAFCQCASCNLHHEYNSHIFTSAYIKKFGAPAYMALVRLANKSHKFLDSELEALYQHFKTKYEDF